MVWNPVDLGSRQAIEGRDYSASLYIPYAAFVILNVHDVIYIQFKFNCKVKSGSGHTRLVARRRPAPELFVAGAVRLRRYAYWKEMSSPKVVFDDDAVQVVKLVLEGSRFKCP